MVATLTDAEPPHRMALRWLEDGEKPRVIDGVLFLDVKPAVLRASLEKQMEKAIESRTLDRPDEVVWTTAMGLLRCRIEQGIAVQIRDRRSVKTLYKRSDGTRDDSRRYEIEMTVDFRDVGRPVIELPVDVKSRLGME
jgi:hypothetical protein